ncbi:hypothetical protein QTP88_024333 [Uroleucon formosanum]
MRVLGVVEGKVVCSETNGLGMHVDVIAWSNDPYIFLTNFELFIIYRHLKCSIFFKLFPSKCSKFSEKMKTEKVPSAETASLLLPCKRLETMECNYYYCNFYVEEVRNIILISEF